MDLVLGSYLAFYPHPAALVPWLIFRLAAYAGRTMDGVAGHRGRADESEAPASEAAPPVWPELPFLSMITAPLAAYCSWLLLLAAPSLGSSRPDIVLSYAVAALFLAATSTAGFRSLIGSAPASIPAADIPRLPNPGRRSVTRVLGAGLSGALVLFAIGTGWRVILGWISNSSPLPEHVIFSGSREPWTLFAVVCLMVPLGEELFFRGYLLDSMGRSFGRGTAVFASTMAFSAVHSMEYFPGVFLSGLVLCRIRGGDRGNGLPAAVVAHGLNNLFFLAAMFWR